MVLLVKLGLESPLGALGATKRHKLRTIKIYLLKISSLYFEAIEVLHQLVFNIVLEGLEKENFILISEF